MSEAMPSKKVVNVLTAGMDSRKLAVFRMAFKMHTLQTYRLLDDTPGAAPDVAIVDTDGVNGQQIWETFRAAHPDLPAIITTVTPDENAPAPVLAKPVRVETLFPLLRQVMAGQAPAPKAKPVAPKPAQAVARPVAPEPSKPDPAPAAPPMAAATASGTAGSAPRRPAPAPVQQLPETIERFDPGQGLLGQLIAIHRAKTPSMVTIADQNGLLILPEQDRVLLLCDMDTLRAAAMGSQPVASRPLTPQDKPENSDVQVQSLLSLLWQVALWTSRGRLIDGIHILAPLRIRHWPNLTRLAPVPNGLRIAAFMVRSPANLRIIVRMLNTPPRDVFDFLAASYSIGILDIPEHKTATVTTMESQPAAEEELPSLEKKDRGGLLSRLLRKVVGL
jgi:hypothetical protein